ncbi:SDR family oxidoreductase [uncultured Jannaschia sp.]|uniref:SDR family oxidoreductase n=1 Tax=uncultured Jannaschia sp. TaxID=293347 RepID=UPI00263875F9|nr:SDR family oxidoreductase [uncultured Jannaschia sp.]
MHVFVTGATGFIGTAVVHELLGAGHKLVGLARSDEAAAKLKAAGGEAHRGALNDLESLAEGARQADGVAHLAFNHDFSRYEENAETDRLATAALAGALEGTGKPLVVTSGTAVLPPGRMGVETDPPTAQARAKSELVLAWADRGVRVSVVRLAPSVHGRGDAAFVPALVAIARDTGVSAYIGDGANRWPAVHRLDAARLFRLALERGEPGARFHGVAEEGLPTRLIAEAIGKGLGLPVRSISPEDAAGHFGWLAGFLQLDAPASSARTRDALGWVPTEPGLIQDMRESGYFADAGSS